MKKFNDYVPRITRGLRKEFPNLSDMSIAAILGNLAHESGGFEKLQEISPLVKGSRGGYGWAQWTGPRRRDFEAWASRRKLPVSSFEANFGFLVHELKTSEAASIPAVRKGTDLSSKVIAFEKAYERAGIKHYSSRIKWASKALDLIQKMPAKSEAKVRETAAAGTIAGGVVVTTNADTASTTLGTAADALIGSGSDWAVNVGAVLKLIGLAIVLGGVAWFAYSRWKNRDVSDGLE